MPAQVRPPANRDRAIDRGAVPEEFAHGTVKHRSVSEDGLWEFDGLTWVATIKQQARVLELHEKLVDQQERIIPQLNIANTQLLKIRGSVGWIFAILMISIAIGVVVPGVSR